MSISGEQIQYIARLARLKTDSEEAGFYAEQLTRIMDLVEEMNKIDTDGIEPMAHPQDTALRLRADEVTEENLREEYQNIAPATEDGLYLVPKVIE